MSDTEAGSNSPHLNKGEQEQAADHSTPAALVIHEIVREEGEAAMERTVSALTWSALAAGLSMGFSFLMQAVLDGELPDSEWRPLVSSFGYTIGFVIVILGRQQLFTESTLSVVLPVLTRRDLKTVVKALRLWGIVLTWNLIGTEIDPPKRTPILLKRGCQNGQASSTVPGGVPGSHSRAGEGGANTRGACARVRA